MRWPALRGTSAKCDFPTDIRRSTPKPFLLYPLVLIEHAEFFIPILGDTDHRSALHFFDHLVLRSV